MKLNVIKDEHGKVVATFENPAPGGPSLRPVLKPGQKVLEIDVAADYKKDIQTFYKQQNT
jgi:hypothetical protein